MSDTIPDDLAPADPVLPSDDRPRLAKSDAAFRTISEVAEELNVPQHVLRFWETKFSHVRPLKRGGGRRYYRPEDVTLLKRIRALLYTDGMTIRGVQKLLRESPPRTHGVIEQSATTPQAAHPVAVDGMPTADVRRLLSELTALRDDLRAALRAA